MLSLGRICSHRFITLTAACLVVVSAGCQATNGWMFNNSGMAYYQRGNYAMARDEFRRAAINDPYNPSYRQHLAMALMKTGETSAAENVLRQNLTQVSAMHQPTYHTLAELLVQQNRQGEAQELIAGWETSQPYLPEAHLEMAWMQRQMGDTYGAEQSLRKTLQMNPRHPQALAHLGQLYQDTNQPDRAMAMYQRSLATRWSQPEVQSRVQTLAHGTLRQQSRSGMMMNPNGAMLAAGPTSMMTSGPVPMMAAYGPQPMMNPQQPMMTMSPAPTWQPAGAPVITSAPVVVDHQAAMAAAPTLAPPASTTTTTVIMPPTASPAMASGPTLNFQPPIIVNGPTPAVTSNADPAHANMEMIADLPEVTPH